MVKIELGDANVQRILRMLDIKTATKTDLSGFSYLSAKLKERFGLSVTECMNPLLKEFSVLGRVYGGLMDNVAGDSEDTVLLEDEN
jgi:hypothetical protein